MKRPLLVLLVFGCAFAMGTPVAGAAVLQKGSAVADSITGQTPFGGIITRTENTTRSAFAAIQRSTRGPSSLSINQQLVSHVDGSAPLAYDKVWATRVDESVSGVQTKEGRHLWDDPIVGYLYGIHYITTGGGAHGWGISRAAGDIVWEPGTAPFTGFTSSVSEQGPSNIGSRIIQWRIPEGSWAGTDSPDAERVTTNGQFAGLKSGAFEVWAQELWYLDPDTGRYTARRKVLYTTGSGGVYGPPEPVGSGDSGWVSVESTYPAPGRLSLNPNLQATPFVVPTGGQPLYGSEWEGDAAAWDKSIYCITMSFATTESAEAWYLEPDAPRTSEPSPTVEPTRTVSPTMTLDPPDWLPDGAQDWIDRITSYVRGWLDRAFDGIGSLFFFLGGGFGYDNP